MEFVISKTSKPNEEPLPPLLPPPLARHRGSFSQEMQEILAKQQVITAPVTTPIFEARGCDECHGTGYAGRVALMELFEMNSELRDLIEEAASMSAMRAAAFKNGFRSLYQEGLAQVLNGATSLEEIKCLSYTAM